MQKLHIFLLATIALCSCRHIGPDTVHRDRLDYNLAIADSWKEQTLLNIVKLRYADMPLFVEVASIVSGYSLESSVNLGGTVSSAGAVQGDFLNLGGAGKYTDRPTITYAPITGKKFNQSFMTPIPPTAILFMMQSGWAADMIFPLTVDSINGLRSRYEGGANQRSGDTGYYRVIELLRAIQQSGAVGMRIEQGDDGKRQTVLFFYQEGLTPSVASDLKELYGLLGIAEGDNELQVAYGLLPEGDREIAVLTRSTLQMMIKLAFQVDVPDLHVAEGRTLGTLPLPEKENARLEDLIDIRNSADRPEDAFTAVRYQDHWFYIDDRDFRSKRSFAILMLLFSLNETGGQDGLPLVTIPAG